MYIHVYKDGPPRHAGKRKMDPERSLPNSRCIHLQYTILYYYYY